jgi:hypothetical protein
VPCPFLRDPQHLGKVALDGGLDGFVSLNVTEIPGAEGHQRGRRQDNR